LSASHSVILVAEDSGVSMKRIPGVVSSVVTAVVTCCGLVAGAGSAAAATPAAAGHRAAAVAAPGGTWGTAQEVPGQTAPSAVSSISCASPGNCAAGGGAGDGADGFVVDETNGTWGAPQTISGAVISVSCASPGNCVAGGNYGGAIGNWQAFVIDETAGSWGPVQEVPGFTALNADNSGTVSSVSCGSAGNCVAGGHYRDSSGHDQAFVADETDGTWGTAQEVPGTAALNVGGYAGISSVSCTSAGNCAAGGWYDSDSSHDYEAFVVDQTGGSWGTAQEVPGSAALNTGGNAGINSVSCPSAGNCAAGGWIADPGGAFVVDETDGSWGTAQDVPGIAALNTGNNAQLISVSCASAGNCAAGGWYTDSSNATQAFVVDETAGSWGTAQEVPGSATLNARGFAKVYTLSCASAGNCAAGGVYTDSSRHYQAFVVDETAGSWGTAQEVPGTAALNTGDTGVNSVSCPAAGYCAAAGAAETPSGLEPFIVNEASATSTSISPSSPAVIYGDEQAGPVSVTVTSPYGTPGGKVTVSSGGATLCTARLASGTGSCVLPATGLPVGTAQLTASYNGSTDFATSTSAAASLTVITAPAYDPVTPVRILDTRNGTGGYSAPVGPGKTISLQVTGVHGVPASGVTAVVLNVTATGPTASSFVTVYADGQARPITSNLDFAAGQTIPNLVVVPVGADGRVDFYNDAGRVNLLADLAGYYTTSGGSWLDTTGPVRILDTRNGTGGYSAPVGPGKTISLQVTGVHGVPASGVTAVVLNVTATGPTASSFVTVYADGQARPITSNLDFTAGQTIPNLVVVPVGADGKIDLYNDAGNVNLLADLAGYFVG
jgi:hypothetical protein